MFTFYLYQIFKNNLKVFYFFDLIRDSLLFLIIVIPIILFFTDLIKKKKFNKFLLLELSLTFIFLFFLTSFFKNFYPSLRPISYFYPGKQYFDSFPSSHTALAIGIANIIFNNYIEWGIFLYLLGSLVALFSWFSLQHWPVDILAGIFLGLLISTLVLDFVKLLLRLYVKDTKEEF